MADYDYDYDFDNIPIWQDEGGCFDVTADPISGRIPVTRLERWQDFASLLESPFFNQPRTQLIFRGHRRFDWGLMPTLGRVTEAGVISEVLAKQQLDLFRLAVRGRLSGTGEDDDELWSVGQHHGLMTPLLDWTHSPYVALFFAFAREDQEDEQNNPYRAVYALNKSFIGDEELCPDIRLFEPRRDDHGRLVNQAGLFTFSPYDSTIENTLTDTLASEDFPDDELRSAGEDEQANIIARYICKIYIKNEDRDGCVRHLRRMNVHHASLFPDLIGAAEYCNLMVAEEQREYEIGQADQRSQPKTEGDNTITPPLASASAGVGDPIVAITHHGRIAGFLEILKSCAGGAVEPGRLQLIAEHFDRDLIVLQVVDWHERDASLASMRTKMRITLRRFGYPENTREEVISKVIAFLIEIDKEIMRTASP